MRRFAALLLSLAFLLTMGAAASAASDTRVLFDDQEVHFDAAPFVADGRTLVPVRALAERLGFTVGWDEAEQKITLTKGEMAIQFWIGSTRVIVNGKEGTVEVPPKKVNDRTFVPVRFVAERLGAYVTWDGEQNAAVVASGGALFAKLNRSQKPVDQKTTGDFQIQLDISDPKQAAGGNVSLQLPVHVETQVYHDDMLMKLSLQRAAVDTQFTYPTDVQVAVKGGEFFNRNFYSERWQKFSDPAFNPPGTNIAAVLKYYGLGDISKLQPELARLAVASVDGVEAMDGVPVVRLDADLSRVKYGSLLDKLLTQTGIPNPGFTMNVDRYLARYWFDPATQFTHKMTLEATMSIPASEGTKNLALKVTVKGELRSQPVSEPIQFPDFNAPAYTTEEQAAAQAYYDAYRRGVQLPCFSDLSAADAHWKDKDFAAGRGAAARAVACFAEQRTNLAKLTPPAAFAEAHRQTDVYLEKFGIACAAYEQAFSLAAQGYTPASDAKKADVDKLVKAAAQAFAPIGIQITRPVRKYDLK